MSAGVAARVRTTGWLRWLFVAYMFLVAGGFLFGSRGVQTASVVGADVAALAAVAVRARASQRGNGDPWRLMLAAFGVYSVATVLGHVLPAYGHSLPVPSPIDAVFFVAYLLYGLVLRRLSARFVGQDRRAWLEVVIVGLGLSAPLWELWVRPTFSVLSAAGTIALVSYPAALLLLFAAALRLALLADHREVRQLLVLGWIGGELAAGLYLAVAGIAGSFSPRSPWLLFRVASWLCVGLAALHPGWTPPRPLRPAHEPGRRTRLVWLGSSALLPVLSAAAVVYLQDRLPVYAVTVAIVVLVLLLVRVSNLIVDLGEQQRGRAELQLLAEQLSFQALHDPLTGVANRALLNDRIDYALRQRRREPGAGVAVLWLDLDGFKRVNDALGSHIGDQLLTEVARRLVIVARAGDTVARIGGDEFALVLPDVDAGQAAGVAERIAETLAIPFDFGVNRIVPAGSVGVALSDGSHDTRALLKHAEVAMYQAKAHAPGRHHVFSAYLHTAALQRQALSTAVKGAADRGELYLDYQPVIDLTDDSITGVEALVRWQHPTLGLLAPLQWIAVAEANGSISAIGAWVLEEACRQLLRWDLQHPVHLPLDIAVNVSPRQLDEDDIVHRLRDVLLRTGVDPRRVVLEVTESALATDTEMTIRRLEQLKTLGCQIAIDDFGTGFSSLNLLRRLPIDLIKIDKVFVDGIAQDPGERAFTTAIVTLANSLGKGVVAEGIERGDQLAHLKGLRCEYGQGYWFSPPVSAQMISQALTVS